MPPARFLRQYWQRRPLLVRGAFPGFRDPVTPDGLAGFACAEDVESRLVMERGGPKPWSVTHGPQRPERLKRLPDTHWTLLVQGVDRLVPGAAALLEPFRFIPDWRVDDVMVSFAPRHGSVGPHVDSYDVFLLQGMGRRRWRIDTRAPGDFRPGMDLRLLKRFRPEREWVLEAGDMLYLPPGVAHHGVALEDCLTYSIGFRAPGAAELLAAALPRLAAGEASRYRDPPFAPARHPGEIPRSAVRTMRSLMEGAARRLSEADAATIIGEVLTEPKGPGPEARAVEVGTLLSRLKRGAALVHSPGCRMAYLRAGNGAVIFADGKSFPLSRGLAFAAPLLTGSRRLPAGVLLPHAGRKGFLPLVAGLVGEGALRLQGRT